MQAIDNGVAGGGSVETARDRETVVLSMVASIGCGAKFEQIDERLANVCRIGGAIVRDRYPTASERLRACADRYFAEFPEQLKPPDEVVRAGWVESLPRFRVELERRLASG